MNSRSRLKPQFTVTQEWARLSAARPVNTQEFHVVKPVVAHDHLFYEICFVHRGKALHCTDFYDAEIARGSVVVMSPGTIHAFSAPRALDVTNIYYLAEWMLTDTRQLWEHDGLVPLFLADSLFKRLAPIRIPQFQLDARETADLEREIVAMKGELAAAQPSLLFLKSVLTKFMIQLSRAYIRDESREVGFQFRREIWSVLDSIEQCIAESEPFQVAEAADKLDLSLNHLVVLFKNATGFPPLEYYQRRRIHHARRMLLNPRLSITDIGYSLNFADTAHFSRQFKRVCGVGPRQYRTQMMRDPAAK
jgi:AraC family L-rhamnose operon regulatory protein RhaS